MPLLKPQHYLSASKAAAIDAALMSPHHGFSLPQLMELAGQSIAHVLTSRYPSPSAITLVCGPGNNGGDGLVAARHLAHFGHAVSVYLPKPATREPFTGLCAQLRALHVPVREALPLPAEATAVVDAVFGFSFRGAGGVRAPYGPFLRAMSAHAGELVSVDVPSGWDVDGGSATEGVRTPDVLVSLTGPKGCAKGFQGAHYVGGRFVPQELCEELGFEVVPFEGAETYVRVG